jgi:antitoxin (DNA-binding transcriptional repressor) of toxin-antitoxin stability system
MDPVNVAELKNRLSRYLRIVRRGGAVLVRDRQRVIARIEPAGEAGRGAGPEADRLADLEARGVVRRGRGRITRAQLERRPRVRADVVGALLAERDEGR